MVGKLAALGKVPAGSITPELVIPLPGSTRKWRARNVTPAAPTTSRDTSGYPFQSVPTATPIPIMRRSPSKAVSRVTTLPAGNAWPALPSTRASIIPEPGTH